MVSLTEGFRIVKEGDTFEKPLFTLTFDDGDRTVHDQCLPILRQIKAPACVFVVPSFVETGCRRVSTGRFPTMTWEHLHEWVGAGLEVGAHTMNHIPLNQATLERCQFEILESKRILEKKVGVEIRHFAYPFGHFRRETHDWLEEQNDFLTVSTTAFRDNFPKQPGKHLFRKWIPHVGPIAGYLRDESLYESVQAVHQRRMMNSIAPILFHDKG